MKRLVYGLIALLAVLHQDFWWWDDSQTLVFRFLPVGLAYHVGISIVAGVLWGLASHYCWPQGVDLPGHGAEWPGTDHHAGDRS